MKTKRVRTTLKAASRRLIAVLLSVCLVVSLCEGLKLLIPTAHAAGGPTSGATRQADPSTMDTYQQMLDFSENTRYAGRLWSDKTVFALGYPDAGDRNGLWNAGSDTTSGVLTLTPELDGLTGEIKLNDDFLHVYSALGSSLEVIGVPPVRAVIVFDNSGSMYNSYSGAVEDGETLWGRQRIALTVEAIDRAIDTLMEASVYNEVSVVLFGDGANTGDDANDTHCYHGNSTAVTILPMKHYEPQKDGEYTPYLTAGWKENSDAVPNGASLLQSDKAYGSGWVFVNNDICKLNTKYTGEGDNPGHSWYKTEEGGNWTGWNGCGTNKYTAYQNGTTNIQAGYYVGMQELMNAEKIEQVGNQEYQCVPSLVMLTDGQATDMMQGNFIKPTAADGSTYPAAKGFVNDTGNRLRSFTGVTNSNNKEIGNFWDMFVEINGEDGDNKGKYQSAAWQNENKDNGGKYKKEAPTNDGLKAMERVANNYSDSVASMLLGTLMTTAYYKEAVKRAYNVADNWNIYTISVDMIDLKTMPGNAAETAKGGSNPAPTNELPQNWEYGINSNAPTMDPADYFYKDGKVDIGWLVDKGYIDGLDKTGLAAAIADTTKDADVTGQTVYPDWSVGEMLIQGIVTAAQKLNEWQSGSEPINLSYQSWEESKGILTRATKKVEDKDTDVLDENRNYTPKDTDKWIPGRYVNPWTHGNGYLLQAKQEVEFPALSASDETDTNPYGLTAADVMKNIAYNNFTYYASTANGSAQELSQTFVEIVDSITEHLFVPVGGTNDLGVGDAVTYMDPVGKYMDVKDVKNLALFGKLYGVTKAAVYDYQWNHQYMENVGTPNAPLKEGWYKGEPVAETEEIKDGNADVQYGGDGATPDGYYTAEKAWADGWVYRLSYQNASKFVPTLGSINNDVENPDEDKQLDKMRHTTYTFYRIDIKEDARNTLHMNPAYGTDEDIPEKLKYDGENQEHLKTKSVYALSDLRIWVEKSGDYSDSLGGTETDTDYDEALWINIPVNMLPLCTMSINLGDTVDGADDTWSYTTNIPKEGDTITAGSAESASFPLRVFYTVGVSDEVLEASNRINMAGAISPEYILQNKIATAAAAAARGIPQGNLEFFSNWYNPLNRYKDYATTGTDYTYGDPVTSFSPSANNRYYIFEKGAAPIQRGVSV